MSPPHVATTCRHHMSPPPPPPPPPPCHHHATPPQAARRAGHPAAHPVTGQATEPPEERSGGVAGCLHTGAGRCLCAGLSCWGREGALTVSGGLIGAFVAWLDVYFHTGAGRWIQDNRIAYPASALINMINIINSRIAYPASALPPGPCFSVQSVMLLCCFSWGLSCV